MKKLLGQQCHDVVHFGGLSKCLRVRLDMVCISYYVSDTSYIIV